MVTTKKGDKGKSYFMGKVVDKDSPLLEVIGEIDELQAILEIVGDEGQVADDLSLFMGAIGCGSQINIKEKVFFVEKEIEDLEKRLPKLEKFLRFKNKQSLLLNWARTVCRRVERRIVSLSKENSLDEKVLEYFNRLSDYLFLKAREKDI